MNKEQNFNLELSLIKEYGKGTTLDGILNLETYNATFPKILWILKEPNYGEQPSSELHEIEYYPDNELLSIYEELKADMIDYYQDVTVYSHWKSTFENILYVTFGIINKEFIYENIPNIDSPDATINGNYYLNNVAFINIKKIPGGGKSIDQQISRYYDRHKDFILKQIELINPDIIINCSRVDKLLYDNATDINENYDYSFGKFGTKLVINTNHPMASKYNNQEENYVNGILEIIKDHFEY